MQSVRVVLVGGFLGAGKTTLLARATEQLMARGSSVGLITNDQVAGLVDTTNLGDRGFSVREVSGGCFCCRYPDLVQAVESLASELGANVVLAEPVGSCTDLLATVSRPLGRQLGQRLSVAPLTAVADALRLRDLLEGRARHSFPSEILYIFRKQLEEADLIVLNKIDLLSAESAARLRAMITEAFPGARVQPVCAHSGQGVSDWIDSVVTAVSSHRPSIAVDYDVYAAGEAALGWLNATIDLRAVSEPDWAGFQVRLLDALRAECARSGCEIAHVKAAIKLPGGTLLASLTSTRGTPLPTVVGVPAANAPSARMIFNARVHMTPEDLDATLDQALREVAEGAVLVEIAERTALRPGRPVPVFRLLDPALAV